MNTCDPRWAGSRPDDECGHVIPLASTALFGAVVLAVVYLVTSAPVVLLAGVVGLYGVPVVVSLIADRLTTRRWARRRAELQRQARTQRAGTTSTTGTTVEDPAGELVGEWSS